MNCRRYGSKATLGFWSLVLVAAAVSTDTLPVVLLLLVFAALVVGGTQMARRVGAKGDRIQSPACRSTV